MGGGGGKDFGGVFPEGIPHRRSYLQGGALPAKNAMVGFGGRFGKGGEEYGRASGEFCRMEGGGCLGGESHSLAKKKSKKVLCKKSHLGGGFSPRKEKTLLSQEGSIGKKRGGEQRSQKIDIKKKQRRMLDWREGSPDSGKEKNQAMSSGSLGRGGERRKNRGEGGDTKRGSKESERQPPHNRQKAISNTKKSAMMSLPGEQNASPKSNLLERGHWKKENRQLSSKEKGGRGGTREKLPKKADSNSSIEQKKRGGKRGGGTVCAQRTKSCCFPKKATKPPATLLQV